MKKIFYLFTLLLLSTSSFSQAPQGISYQAVVRNSANALVVSSPVSAFITIKKDSANGDVVYGEIDNGTTNANGLFSTVIGNGQSQIGSLSNINWGSGTYYIKSAIDPTGGNNRTIVGSSKILSVPYALYAANGVQNGNKVGDMQYWDGSKWTTITAGTNGSVLTLCNGVPTWGGCGVVAGLATVTSSAASSVTSTGALISGNVTADGGSTVTSRGICYSYRTVNPTLDNPNLVSSISSGSGTGSFTASISGLLANTTYTYSAYATNSAGTAYSTPQSFTTPATTTTYTLGQSYGGGIIFYLDNTGQHGLIAAPTDLSNGIQWYNGGLIVTGASGTAVSTGQTNTASIISTQGTGSYAAYITSQTANGYSDWFLPSIDELNLMYTNLYVKGLGTFTATFYWSSSEKNQNEAWVHDFGGNSNFGYWKSNKANVRPIRKF